MASPAVKKTVLITWLAGGLLMGTVLYYSFDRLGPNYFVVSAALLILAWYVVASNLWGWFKGK